jgi:hypothetical protein
MSTDPITQGLIAQELGVYADCISEIYKRALGNKDIVFLQFDRDTVRGLIERLRYFQGKLRGEL